MAHWLSGRYFLHAFFLDTFRLFRFLANLILNTLTQTLSLYKTKTNYYLVLKMSKSYDQAIQVLHELAKQGFTKQVRSSDFFKCIAYLTGNIDRGAVTRFANSMASVGLVEHGFAPGMWTITKRVEVSKQVKNKGAAA